MNDKRRLWRYGLFALIAIVVIALLTVHRLTQRPTSEIVTAQAVIGDVEKVVLAIGAVQAYKQVSVGAQASGQLKSLNVALGDSVKCGALIAEIDPLVERNALLNAEAALQLVRAQRQSQVATLKLAELEFDRQKEMLAEHATPRATYDAAEATLASARANIGVLDAQIVQAQSSVDTAKLNLGYTKIRAPMDGEVVAIITRQGQTVNANQIIPTIIKLAQLDLMTVRAQISEADVVRVKPGQEVYFTIVGEPDHRYSAKLRAIEPAPDSIGFESGGMGSEGSAVRGGASSAVYYNGLFDVHNEDRKLRIAMTAEVSIVLERAKRTLTIPSAALIAGDGERSAVVQVLNARGQSVRRKVTVGVNNNVNAQILDGLIVGEPVIIGNSNAANAQDARSSWM